MTILRRYLIVRADGEVRASKTTQRMTTNEVAIPIEIDQPDSWGRIDSTQKIEVKLPGPPRVAQSGKPRRGARRPETTP